MTTAEPAESEAVRMVRATEARRNPWGREVGSRGEQVALLIDFENLVLGASASLPDRTGPDRTGPGRAGTGEGTHVAVSGVWLDHDPSALLTDPWAGAHSAFLPPIL